ncbi:helix-turn-helix domain-containing protein [Moheibacter lacus]|uniref:Helix-turn-helix domain-containing protein n=1 Tax=Moheibacter lacus TaxID=2745851 RepID=A0A838ZTK0_9FLAO|nr:helix-turn-helix domain-containing protein [Moheibacter lacus]MBA5630325.1 helix-turn-helix domain-containing protein [Moheibacter lacus]
MNYITNDDLEKFRVSLIEDIKKILQTYHSENTENNENTEWLRSKMIRKILNISPGTLQNLRTSGKIRYQKVLGSYYYSKSDLLKLFDGK